MRRDVFQGIADPTRRSIITLLAAKPLPMNAVSENFEVSRTAIAKHLKILLQCGLISIDKKGREKYCRADLKKLKEVAEWTAHYRAFWTEKLDALENFLDENQQNTNP